MTREEAIKELSVEYFGDSEKIRESKRMAIKALEQELCENCISRAEAKRIVDYYIQFYDGQFRINESIDKLPSVQPIRHIGKWIYCYGGSECSVCHCREDGVSNFCPNCGAKMESEDKE